MRGYLTSVPSHSIPSLRVSSLLVIKSDDLHISFHPTLSSHQTSPPLPTVWIQLSYLARSSMLKHLAVQSYYPYPSPFPFVTSLVPRVINSLLTAFTKWFHNYIALFFTSSYQQLNPHCPIFRSMKHTHIISLPLSIRFFLQFVHSPLFYSLFFLLDFHIPRTPSPVCLGPSILFSSRASCIFPMCKSMNVSYPFPHQPHH